MGNDWIGYRANTDKAAVRMHNEEVDRRHGKLAHERQLTRTPTARRGLLSKLTAVLSRALRR